MLRRKIIMTLLAVGAVAGFASGFRSLAMRGSCGSYCDREEQKSEGYSTSAAQGDEKPCDKWKKHGWGGAAQNEQPEASKTETLAAQAP